MAELDALATWEIANKAKNVVIRNAIEEVNRMIQYQAKNGENNWRWRLTEASVRKGYWWWKSYEDSEAAKKIKEHFQTLGYKVVIEYDTSPPYRDIMRVEW